MAEDGWTWAFSRRAVDQFDGLDPHVRDRIVPKLDEVVESEWRDPADFLEPLTGGPFSNFGSASIAWRAFSTARRRCSKYIASSTGAERTLPTIEDQ